MYNYNKTQTKKHALIITRDVDQAKQNNSFQKQLYINIVACH